MAPFYANRSCDPFTPIDSPCQVGAYIRYAINVTEPADIIAGIEFAKKNNVRLVIRNTGHDYVGRSSGPGSLSLWTHHLKDIEYIPGYKSEAYCGPALKVGAGVQGIEAYIVANRNGVVVVGGACPSVGIAGGYTQGGGHSILMGKYGLGADQTLEFEVVTGEGKLVKASKNENRDLYWALSGGGGGTYGVVTSMTIKAHKDIPVTVARYSFSTGTDDASMAKFYDALDFLHQTIPEYTDRAGYSINIYYKGSLPLGSFFGPEWTKEGTAAFFQPWIQKLESLGLQYSLNITEYPTYFAAYSSMLETITVGTSQHGGRMIPGDTILNKRAQFNQVVKNVIDDGAYMIEVAGHPTLEVAGNPDNAVLPAWRDNAINLIITTPWNDTAEWSQILKDQETITNWCEQFRELTPESGAYLNEPDANQPNFQHEFYGKNYDKLLYIKNKYDPADIFYALMAVGSDAWTEKPDGSLCRNNAY
ncbi:FAD-binding domain-containing protein [Tuber magnatum]|uniref:FAD-binding domain-containing protein n=1 Tax=Tuber magnatum TaxID=42249 RepID=A0A317SIY8_9PEZI|nr:FAD-binding domain-containing protein [Tuber magnatum]